MANMQVYVIVAVLSVFSLIQMGEGLRCYVCQSGLDHHCSDPFNTTLPATRNNWGQPAYGQAYNVQQDCASLQQPSTYATAMKAVCRKQVQISYNQRNVYRTCEWQHPNEKVGKCPDQPVASHIKVEFCETCDTDGCNSAPGSLNINVPVQIFSLLPAIFVSKLAFF